MTDEIASTDLDVDITSTGWLRITRTSACASPDLLVRIVPADAPREPARTNIEMPRAIWCAR